MTTGVVAVADVCSDIDAAAERLTFLSPLLPLELVQSDGWLLCADDARVNPRVRDRDRCCAGEQSHGRDEEDDKAGDVSHGAAP